MRELQTLGEVPLIAHVVFRFGVGGLENGLVNLINRLPSHKYRHAVICIDRSSSFESRLEKSGVPVLSIHKKPGRDWRASKRIFDLLRVLRPTIVHSRNYGALDALLPARLAGVPVRIHGEHGLDVSDLRAIKWKFRIARRLHAPLVTHYIALSRQLATYLRDKVGIDPRSITEIANGVDIDRFVPASNKRELRRQLFPSFEDQDVIVGNVGRLEGVKDPLNLVAAVASACRRMPALRDRIRLVIVGDGSLREAVARQAELSGIEDRLLLTGVRDDVPSLLSAFDVFASPSLAEGFSNTILEAMACGLPVVATDVGENSRLVVDGKTGKIVPPGDAAALGAALVEYCLDSARIAVEGAEARRRIQSDYTIGRMVAAYEALYDRFLASLSPAPGSR
jgi:sugar transferase (PEP-CTERM/EpsH1 system associated)